MPHASLARFSWIFFTLIPRLSCLEKLYHARLSFVQESVLGILL